MPKPRKGEDGRAYHPAVVRDPERSVGPFRVLRRTDGAIILYDDRNPPGDRSVRDENGEVMTWKDEAGAMKAAERMVKREEARRVPH